MQKKTLSAITRTKQFRQLEASGLQIVSTQRQLENGSIALAGKVGKGKKSFRPSYVITANGAVLSNEFVARRVSGTTPSELYKQGLTAVQELLEKRRAR